MAWSMFEVVACRQDLSVTAEGRFLSRHGHALAQQAVRILAGRSRCGWQMSKRFEHAFLFRQWIGSEKRYKI